MVRVESNKVICSIGQQIKGNEVVGMCWGRKGLKGEVKEKKKASEEEEELEEFEEFEEMRRKEEESEKELIIVLKNGKIIVFDLFNQKTLFELFYKIDLVKGVGILRHQNS